MDDLAVDDQGWVKAFWGYENGGLRLQNKSFWNNND
jgi:hypothetical protein